MKRQTFLCFVIIAMLIAGCNGSKNNTWQPITASGDVAPYARRAIEIIDGYLNFRMSSEEASEAFRELSERIEPLDVRDVDSEYSETDQTVAYIIEMLAIGKAKNKTDVEYHQYRDVLAFQIGEPVSGNSYAADQTVYDQDEERQLKELIDIDTLPFDHGYLITGDDVLIASLAFDQMNGVNVADLQQYIQIVYRNIIEKDVKKNSLDFGYARYEQDVFCINLTVLDGDLSGSVLIIGEQATEAYNQLKIKYSAEEIAEMEKYPKEFAILNPLYEFSAIEDLPEALKVASAFAGIN